MKKRENSRAYNSIMNSVFGIFASIITIILNFAVRVILVRELGEEINGLHSLFQSVFNVVAIMEAGISTAIVIHLYKPVKENDYKTSQGIMSFYRNVYAIMAGIFFMTCVVVNIFFIDDIVTTTIEMQVVRKYFALFSMVFVLKYLTYHKRTYLYAEQKNRISIGINIVCEVLFRSLEILAIILWHNYYLFLILMIAETVTANLLCSFYVNNHYPYLKNYKGVKITKKTKSAIFKTIKPLFISQIATTVQQSAKSILVSVLLGNISIVGYFANYQLVVSTAQLLVSQIGGAFTSSFGSLAVENDKKHMYYVYNKVTFYMNWIAIVLWAGFICAIQDFILFVFGKSFVLGLPSVVIIGIEMFIYLLSMPIVSIQNAMGLHNEDKNIMIIQAVIAIILGAIGGHMYGMAGLLIGLIIPQFALTLINKGIIIHKVAFDKNALVFLKMIILDIAKGVILVVISYVITSFIDLGNPLFNMLSKGAGCLVICIFYVCISSYRNPFFEEGVQFIRTKIRRS